MLTREYFRGMRPPYYAWLLRRGPEKKVDEIFRSKDYAGTGQTDESVGQFGGIEHGSYHPH
jgi:hypothetical protein